MPDDHPDAPSSRFTEVTRRAVLRRTALLGSLALVPGLAACGTSDEDAFSGSTTTTRSTDTTSDTTDTTSDTTTTADTTAAAASAPDGAELLVRFTFEAGSSDRGPARNPYVAVWVEDTDGNLVKPLAAWYLQEEKGQRWLNELRAWYALGGPDASTAVTGATRVAGDYSLTWDGTDLDGAPAAAGEYFINIEAAREHGPYELISETFTYGGERFTRDLEPQGELTAASIQLTA